MLIFCCLQSWARYSILGSALVLLRSSRRGHCAPEIALLTLLAWCISAPALLSLKLLPVMDQGPEPNATDRGTRPLPAPANSVSLKRKKSTKLRFIKKIALEANSTNDDLVAALGLKEPLGCGPR